ncbi:MAG: type III pantothenate kinase [Sphaerochaetaceae bacterium]|jgi:type III pantothenate kinase|nr:type III pantothenate kinase [Sphaerochaetaceae bacterium]HHU88940.1 type III pantothenate kinase [Spirochaetales bacterium]
MLLVVDIGNTHVVMGLYKEEQLVATWRIYSDQKKTSDEYAVIVERIIRQKGFKCEEVKRGVISSVVPNLTRSFQKVIYTLTAVDPLMVSHATAPGIVLESIPPQLGYDLLANAVAAHSKWPNGNCVIIDFGTALTFTIVSKEGQLLGAAIAPGLLTAVNSLFHNTAQIPQVSLDIPVRAIGRDSDESIKSGIMFGYAGLVKELLKRIEEEVGERLFVVATGGLSSTIAPLLTQVDSIEPHLTLEGLKIIANATK